MALRILRRLLNAVPADQQASGFILWLQNRGQNGSAQVERWQTALMEPLGAAGRESVVGGLHQWYFANAGAPIRTPTVLLHGYASSAVSFHRNLAALGAQVEQLYALDLPGNGMSQELPLGPAAARALARRGGARADIRALEDYYLDALERWRAANGLETLNVVGHSFGGYLAFKYALRHPARVQRLCLVSPLGVERNSGSVHARQGDAPPDPSSDPASPHYTRAAVLPPFLFEQQLRVLRWLGPLGAHLLWQYVNASFSRVPGREFHRYTFALLHRLALRPLPRKLFTGLFTNALLARDPLLDSLAELKVPNVQLLYGDHDWMDARAGRALVAELNALRGRPDASLAIVPAAGHNLFLDNPEDFHSWLLDFLRV